jgi:hypothetical protein
MVTARKFEDAVAEGVKSGQRNELKLVAHRCRARAEISRCRAVEFLLPIEGRRAVVASSLPGNFFYTFGESFRFTEIWLARFAPNHVGIS